MKALKINSSLIKHLSLPLLAVALLAGQQTLSAATLYSDNFTSDTVGIQPAGWWANNTAGAGLAALAAVDNTAPLAGNAMRFYGGSGNSVMITTFSAFTLAAAGDFIELSLDVHSTQATPGGAQPYMGLYNSEGTAMTENVLGSTGPEGDDKGFAIGKTLNATTSDFKIFYAQNAQGFPNSYATAATSSSGIDANNNTTAYTMTLTLTRNASDGLDILASFGGYSSSYTQTAPTTFTFDEIFLMGNGLLTGGERNFDNVLVTTSVPEPTTWMTLLGGAGLLGLFQRSRSRKNS